MEIFDNDGQLIRKGGYVQVPEHIWDQLRDKITKCLETLDFYEGELHRRGYVLPPEDKE